MNHNQNQNINPFNPKKEINKSDKKHFSFILRLPNNLNDISYDNHTFE